MAPLSAQFIIPS